MAVDNHTDPQMLRIQSKTDHGGGSVPCCCISGFHCCKKLSIADIFYIFTISSAGEIPIRGRITQGLGCSGSTQDEFAGHSFV